MACVPEDNSHRAPSPQGQWASNYLPTAMHSQKLSFHSFQIDRNMIVRTVLEFSGQPNGIPSGSKSEGKRSPRSYSIQFERKWKYSFLSAVDRNITSLFREPIHMEKIYHCVVMIGCFQGASIVPQCCRETRVFRTAVRLKFAVFLVCL